MLFDGFGGMGVWLSMLGLSTLKSFVGLECMGYLVNCFVVSGFAKAFYVWVGAGGK